ncbi:hypothetical protein WJX74_005164 [Apatococcus lobatus]|uniref:Non-haem dioxygenase N-terminal domain-containing protein n=1 Tax=Apatococcus lobatus TaxID=904363 RepID=A0AAW1RAN8_9CHLO
MPESPPTSTFSSKTCDITCISYEELTSGTAHQLCTKLQQGFGTGGLGIVTISDVPGLSQLRARLLPMAAQLASLPEAVLTGLEDPDSNHNFGWARGKEALEDGRPDLNKGSFYANPTVDRHTEDKHLLSMYPGFCRPNIWPANDLPELREAFRELGLLIIHVGCLLADHCGRMVAEHFPGTSADRLHNSIASSPCSKGRLLHYYPSHATSVAEASWCGWHTDVSSLTGLTSAMYLQNGQEVQNSDPAAGLYIRSSSGEVVKACIPHDHLAFQMGEAMQVHSGGFFKATPHCVRGAGGKESSGMSRNTFAVFIQPRWDEQMDIPPAAISANINVAHWTPNVTFGEFSEHKFQQYSQISVRG